jgi:hypothetical protein
VVRAQEIDARAQALTERELSFAMVQADAKDLAALGVEDAEVDRVNRCGLAGYPGHAGNDAGCHAQPVIGLKERGGPSLGHAGRLDRFCRIEPEAAGGLEVQVTGRVQAGWTKVKAGLGTVRGANVVQRLAQSLAALTVAVPDPDER